MASYDDEIDLYGDAEVQQQQGGSNDNNNGNNGYKPTSSIPTFISEARGGTGKIPVRDEYQRSPDPSNNQARAGSQDRSGSHGLEGIIPKGGDYGAPGQWKTKPVSTVRPSDMPEEGKMFVGGLNWETTEDGMRKYFEQFGPVSHCTIMRDPNTDRSRGFGFLTFADASAVNVVMVKEHYLDGKIIDPKRAIPRPESGIIRNDKLFVRHIPQSMDQGSFREYFSQFGTIVDCNLMMDRETGMHRGFGFVTYEDANSTTTATNQGHEWDGQMLEVKLATQKTQGQSTYVGDRPNRGQRNFNQGNNFQNQDGGMGGYGGGFNNNMGGMGMNNMGAMGGMNAMGGMGGMGNMGNMGMGNQGGFDPMAMAQFFKQMGWGNFNPMMVMGQGGMMGNGMGMPGMMDPSMMGMMGGQGGMGMMGNMGGFGSPNANFGGNAGNFNNNVNPGANQQQQGSGSPSGESGSAGNSFNRPPPKGPKAQQASAAASGSSSDTKPPANAPTGPASMRDSSQGVGPARNSRNNNRDHPYR